MRSIPPNRWSRALALYACSALAVALCADPLDAALKSNGVKGPWAIVVIVNLVYPLSIVLGAAWFPRKRLIPPGAVLAMIFFTLGRMFVRDWRFWNWSAATFATVLSPSVVAGTTVAALVAVAVCAGLAPWRRIGLDDPHLRCTACGYLRHGLRAATCPECGAALR